MKLEKPSVKRILAVSALSAIFVLSGFVFYFYGLQIKHGSARSFSFVWWP